VITGGETRLGVLARRGLEELGASKTGELR
jgi:hypothetical protein